MSIGSKQGFSSVSKHEETLHFEQGELQYEQHLTIFPLSLLNMLE